MAYKIAVATSDGKMVDTHFGHANEFTIYTVQDDGSYEETETRSAVNACTGRECGKAQPDPGTDVMEQAAQNLHDIAYLLVARIGPHAIRTLGRHGITAFDVVMSVDEAIKKIHIYRTRTVQKITALKDAHICK